MDNLFFIANKVYARDYAREIGELPENPTAGLPIGGLDVVIQLVVNVIEMSLVLAIVLAFIFLIIGGIKWITSQGDKQGLTSAKSTVTFSLIGLFMAFIALAILGFVSDFFQVDLGMGISRPSGRSVYENLKDQQLEQYQNRGY